MRKYKGVTSAAKDISESKVIWQDQVILFTILAGGASDPFILPPYIAKIKIKRASRTHGVARFLVNYAKLSDAPQKILVAGGI